MKTSGNGPHTYPVGGFHFRTWFVEYRIEGFAQGFVRFPFSPDIPVSNESLSGSGELKRGSINCPLPISDLGPQNAEEEREVGIALGAFSRCPSFSEMRGVGGSHQEERDVGI